VTSATNSSRKSLKKTAKLSVMSIGGDDAGARPARGCVPISLPTAPVSTSAAITPRSATAAVIYGFRPAKIATMSTATIVPTSASSGAICQS
jgi:hypothetical protein